MENNITDNIIPQLDQVEKIIKFGRKKIVNSIKDSLIKFDNDYNLLQDISENLKRNVENLENIKQEHEEKITSLDYSLKNVTSERDNLQDISENLKRNVENLENIKQEHEEKITSLDYSLKNVTSERDNLQDISENLKRNVENLENIKQEHEKKITSLDYSLKNVTSERDNLQDISENLKRNVENLENIKQEHEKKITSLDYSLKNVTSERDNLQDISENLKRNVENLENIKQEHEEKITSLDCRLKSVTSERDTLQIQNKKFKIKYDLVSKILSAKSTHNNGLEKYKYLFRNDFLDFANEESSLSEEAKAILILQGIEKELELVANFSGVYSKNIIAIGGGFSSGKSAFLNSFFKEKEINLPIGIKPVTAIPTYIISGAKNIIKGYSKDGGVIDVDHKLYEQISHDFVKSFSFNLKDIMPVMAIETPIENYEHICFIDTPGYNPADTDGFTEGDKKTATEYLKQSNSLIWMIGVDSNGTISATDLDFLEELDLVDKKLYIVVSKADLKSENELEDILDEVEESLNDYDIEFEGISAYSAKNKKEYFIRKKSLLNFLVDENNPVEVHKKILSNFYSVIEMYKNAIIKEIDLKKEINTNLNSLELDLLESGFDSFATDVTSQFQRNYSNEKLTVEDRINKMKVKFDEEIKEYKCQLGKINIIGISMEEAINEVFEF